MQQADQTCCISAAVYGNEAGRHRCCCCGRRPRWSCVGSCNCVSFWRRRTREGNELIVIARRCTDSQKQLPSVACHRNVKTSLQYLAQVYESMKGYRLQGSGVGLSANAQHALQAIHPDLLNRQVPLPVAAKRSKAIWIQPADADKE